MRYILIVVFTLTLVGCNHWPESKPEVGFGVGTSMEPVFFSSDVIGINHTPYDIIQKGDYVVFWCIQTGALICHEAWERDGKFWITKGISETYPDPILLGPRNFVGTVKPIR